MKHWLADIAQWVGIKPALRSKRPCCWADHLWHLGDMPIVGRQTCVPLFVARGIRHHKHNAPLTEVLSDPRWLPGGVVFLSGPPPQTLHLPRQYVMQGLEEFFYRIDGKDIFDRQALERLLCARLRSIEIPKVEQFFQGNRLRLPHFSQPVTLSEERTKIIKQMWGTDGQPPPELSWAEVNRIANTGYQSFDNAFGYKDEREQFIRQVKYGKYQLRRSL